jgi:PHD/YefM family antitoxin component YafN of YafNO toxin-antitoxin module
MTEITVEELQENFDEIFERVEDGEHFLIKTENSDLVLIPYNDYSEYFREYFDHDEGC